MKDKQINAGHFAGVSRVACVLWVSFVLLVQSGLAQENRRPVRPRPVPVPSPALSPAEADLEKAHAEFRRSVISSMQEAATKAGIKIRTNDLVAIPFDDNVVAINAAIEGSEKITIEEMKSKGADVLFTFVSLPEGSQIASGFYKVRFYFNQRSNKWMAQWKNAGGSVVLETEAIVEPQSPDRTGALKQQPMCTLGPKGELILFDEHDPFKNIYLQLRTSRGIAVVLPRDVALAVKRLRDATNLYLKHIGENNPQVSSLFSQYRTFAPLSVSPEMVQQYNELVSAKQKGCEDVFYGQCVRVIRCTDGEHNWGVVLFNPDCGVNMGPLIIH